MKSYADEAPEEVMGVVEAAARERVKQLQEEKSEIEKNADQWDDWGDDVVDAAQRAQDALSKVKAPGPGYNGGEQEEHFASGGIVAGPMRALIGEAGKKEIVGDVDFMTRALAGAIDRTGGGTRPSVRRMDTSPQAQQTIIVNVGDQRLASLVLRAQRTNQANGYLPVPARSVREDVNYG